MINSKRHNPNITLGINESLIQLCKYQQSIIDRYKEFIEDNISSKITETDTLQNDPLSLSTSCFREYVIPQTRILLNFTPDILYLWRSLEDETQTVSPEYFLQMAIKEKNEKEAEQNV